MKIDVLIMIRYNFIYFLQKSIDTNIVSKFRNLKILAILAHSFSRSYSNLNHQIINWIHFNDLLGNEIGGVLDFQQNMQNQKINIWIR